LLGDVKDILIMDGLNSLRKLLVVGSGITVLVVVEVEGISLSHSFLPDSVGLELLSTRLEGRVGEISVGLETSIVSDFG
jgi:hypothetical protein